MYISFMQTSEEKEWNALDLGNDNNLYAPDVDGPFQFTKSLFVKYEKLTDCTRPPGLPGSVAAAIKEVQLQMVRHHLEHHAELKKGLVAGLPLD